MRKLRVLAIACLMVTTCGAQRGGLDAEGHAWWQLRGGDLTLEPFGVYIGRVQAPARHGHTDQ